MSARGPRPVDPAESVGERIRVLAAGVAVPDELRRRIAAQREAARGIPARRRVPAAAVAATGLAAALLVVVLAAIPGAVDGPSVGDAAAIALRAPAAAPPARAPSVDGLRFPDYAYDRRDWRPVGIRRQRLGERELTTVSYDAGDGARMGYAIVATPALPTPPRARVVTRAATRYYVLRAHRVTVVTWQRAGHTCVLASRRASATRLLEFAATTAG